MKNKYILLTIIWVFFSTQIFCQSFSDAQKYFDDGRFIEAQQQIDEYLTQNNNDLKGLLLKSRIYYVLGSSRQYSDVVADGKSISIAALKQANSVDVKLVTTILQTESYSLPINLYNDLSNEAITTFNSAAERKDKLLYQVALLQFKNAISFSNYIYEQKWGLAMLDSNNLIYAAKAAINANKENDALVYAKKIVDNKIVKTNENKSFQTIYEWLVYYYRINKNEELLNRYTDFSMLNFSASPYFLLNKIDWLRDNKQYNQLIPNYKLLFAKGFKEPNYYSTYFIDIFNIIFTSKDSSINKLLYKKLFEKEIAAYTTKNKQAFNEILLAAKYYKNIAREMQLAKAPARNVSSIYSKCVKLVKILLSKPKALVPNSILVEAKKL